MPVEDRLEEVVEEVEPQGRTVRPLQRLFLVDVLKDPESRPTLLWALGMLLMGTLVYHWLEGWTLLDSLYFCVISLATVGYGDLAPTTPLARVFTIGYVINGVVILLSVFDRIRIVRSRRLAGGSLPDRPARRAKG